VSLSSHDPVTGWVAVGEVLKLLSTPHQLLDGNVLLQSILQNHQHMSNATVKNRSCIPW
jgi:hypothetical protein